ncbi:hypothetical protein ACIQW9_10060 [Herminiimonas sp. NPDC097707]|uniref:hypothetical protein n=1 Tax=Herminiimonas sp. NPDC097707 TaxID=3364007 RepID=UPI00383AF662
MRGLAAVSFLIGFATVLLTGFALTAALAAGFVAGFTIFFATDFAATVLVLVATLPDSTAVFAGVFFATLDAALSAGLIVLVNALTTFPARVFVDDFATALPAGFARAVTVALEAVFFVLLDFVAVAFIVPCPQ